jgi:zinc transporter
MAIQSLNVLTRSNYGGGESGLICGYVFAAGAAPREIDAAFAQALLATDAAPDAAMPAEAPRARAEGTAFVWLHFNLAHAGASRWLQRHAGLPEEFHEALVAAAPSTRIERADDALVAVINDAQFDFAFEATDIATLCVGVTPRLVVTARRRPLRSIDRLRLQVQGGLALRSGVELLERLLRAQADVLVDIVRGVTARVDGIEDDLLAGQRRHKRAGLGALRRLLVRLQRLLAPEPAALFRLLQHPDEWMAEADVEDLRQSTEEFSVALRDMAALQERIKLLQEEIAASVNEDNNRSLFVLTVVTVLALPINILAGLFGMNVGGVPWGDNPHGFWIVVGVVLSFTAIAGWLALRKTDER